MAGALSFSPILKIGPYPTPGTPRFQRGAALVRPAFTVLSQHHASSHRRGLLFCRRSAPRFWGLRFYNSRGGTRSMEDNFRTASHRAIEVALLFRGIWRLVKIAAIAAFDSNCDVGLGGKSAHRCGVIDRRHANFDCVFNIPSDFHSGREQMSEGKSADRE
jgi:hypothetical protein